MIKNTLFHKIKNQAAKRAIAVGCENDDSVYELEPVGLPQRLCGILEAGGLLYLKDVVFKSKDELRIYPDVGFTTVIEIEKALELYDQHAELRVKLARSFYLDTSLLRFNGMMYEFDSYQ